MDSAVAPTCDGSSREGHKDSIDDSSRCISARKSEDRDKLSEVPEVPQMATSTSQPSSFPAPHVIPPLGEHTHSIILLHGRGSDGEEFADDLMAALLSSGASFKEYFRNRLPSVKWIFPNAISTYNQQFQENMTQWFEAPSLTDTDAQEYRQVPGLRAAVKHIHTIIDAEIQAGITPDQILLGGISQGFATAAHVMLSSAHRFAGFLGMSGWLPLRKPLSACYLPRRQASTQIPENVRKMYSVTYDIPATTSCETLKTPVLITHSKDDDVIASELGRVAGTTLHGLGMQVEQIEYEEGGHWIAEPQGLDDVREFVEARFPADGRPVALLLNMAVASMIAPTLATPSRRDGGS